MQEIHFDNRTFSRYPAGRYRTDGKWSGEKFRDEILSHFIANGEKTTIFLDEAQGFGSSFLEEAFGGLIRKGITFATFQSLVSLRSDDSSLLEEIETYMLDAQGE